MQKFKTGDIVYIKSTNLCNIDPYKVDAFLYNDEFEETYGKNPGDGNVYVLENMIATPKKISALQLGIDYWKNIAQDTINANKERLSKLIKIYDDLGDQS